MVKSSKSRLTFKFVVKFIGLFLLLLLFFLGNHIYSQYQKGELDDKSDPESSKEGFSVKKVKRGAKRTVNEGIETMIVMLPKSMKKPIRKIKRKIL